MLVWMVEEKDIEPHGPVWGKTERQNDSVSNNDFHLNEEAEEYHCPAGNALLSEWRAFKNERSHITKANTIICRSQQTDCAACPMKAKCCSNPDQQISLTDPNARSMATSGRGIGTVGYNVQSAVDDKHHMIIAFEVTNVGNDRAQLSNMANLAREEIGAESLTLVADRGYYKSLEIVAYEQAGITTSLPKPLTSSSKAEGRFGKQDFICVAASDEYRCPGTVPDEAAFDGG